MEQIESSKIKDLTFVAIHKSLCSKTRSLGLRWNIVVPSATYLAACMIPLLFSHLRGDLVMQIATLLSRLGAT